MAKGQQQVMFHPTCLPGNNLTSSENEARCHKYRYTDWRPSPLHQIKSLLVAVPNGASLWNRVTHTTK